MQYNFAPPSIITPQTDFNFPIQNQYDYRRAWTTPSVAQDVSDDTTRPLHIGGQISPLGDSERALLHWRGSNTYAIGHVYRQHLSDYKDSNGKRVNVGYTRDGEAVIVGAVPNALQEYRLGLIRDNIGHDKQPHNQIDALNTRRVVVNATARLGSQEQDNTFNFNARNIHLDRRANNYQLRTAQPNQPHINMEIDRNISEVSADYRLQYGEQRSQIGMQYGHDEHHAERSINTPQGKLRNAYRFPDIHSDHWHIFYDHYWTPSAQHQLSGGISYDYLSADPRAKNKTSHIGSQDFPAPNQIWQQYYGQSVNKKRNTQGVGAALAYEYKPDEQQTYHIALDSLIRQPDNTERFHALPGQNGMGWIGNPFLKPERHNRLTLSGHWQGSGWREYGSVANGDIAGAWKIEVKADYDKSRNFITLDRARGQKGINKDDQNVISRNINATLIGFEMDAAKSLTDNLATRSRLRYQYGENDSDHRPLYHVRPFSADLALDWRSYASFGSYNLGADVHYAHKNSRRDADKNKGLGLDLPMGSYATINLYAGLQTRNRLALTLGINNVFDRKYNAYNEQPHTASLNPNAVAAPERTFWLGFNLNL
ncbi:MAG: TonB-dependent receptor [Cardiobacteriaceae bacterium]|nr:TonB-dependent receptor [Cardiobacteriaceae bacterium]